MFLSAGKIGPQFLQADLSCLPIDGSTRRRTEASVNPGRGSAGNPLFFGKLVFTWDRFGIQDNLLRASRTPTAARRRRPESAVDRSVQFVHTLAGWVPSVPEAPPPGERGVDVPDELRRHHAQTLHSSPNQSLDPASIRGSFCPPRWRLPRVRASAPGRATTNFEDGLDSRRQPKPGPPTPNTIDPPAKACRAPLAIKQPH